MYNLTFSFLVWIGSHISCPAFLDDFTVSSFVIVEGLKVAYDCLHPLHTDLNSGHIFVTGRKKNNIATNKQTINQFTIKNEKIGIIYVCACPKSGACNSVDVVCFCVTYLFFVHFFI